MILRTLCWAQLCKFFPHVTGALLLTPRWLKVIICSSIVNIVWGQAQDEPVCFSLRKCGSLESTRSLIRNSPGIVVAPVPCRVLRFSEFLTLRLDCFINSHSLKPAISGRVKSSHRLGAFALHRSLFSILGRFWRALSALRRSLTVAYVVVSASKSNSEQRAFESDVSSRRACAI